MKNVCDSQICCTLYKNGTAERHTACTASCRYNSKNLKEIYNGLSEKTDNGAKTLSDEDSRKIFRKVAKEFKKEAVRTALFYY